MVEGLDRLSRVEPIQAQVQLAQIVNAGIKVVSASNGKEYSRERLKANPMNLVRQTACLAFRVIRGNKFNQISPRNHLLHLRQDTCLWVFLTFRLRFKVPLLSKPCS